MLEQLLLSIGGGGGGELEATQQLPSHSLLFPRVDSIAAGLGGLASAPPRTRALCAALGAHEAGMRASELLLRLHLKLEALPLGYFPWLLLMLGGYAALVQAVKGWYARRYGWQ